MGGQWYRADPVGQACGLTPLPAVVSRMPRSQSFEHHDATASSTNTETPLDQLLEDLSGPARRAALDVVRASYSVRGFSTIRDVMRINDLLGEITGHPDMYGEGHQ